MMFCSILPLREKEMIVIIDLKLFSIITILTMNIIIISSSSISSN